MAKRFLSAAAVAALGLLMLAGSAAAQTPPKKSIFQVGRLKPVDSVLKVRVGQMAPDFILPSLGGGKVRLSQFRGKKNVVLSFVPAAWTPVCSEQWPGYNLALPLIAKRDAIVLGITTDNLPTLYAWTQAMGGALFPVLSDFWPHGAVAQRLGILRSDGTSERALFIIDKKGVIRYIDVHDINQRPKLEVLIQELDKLQ